MRVCGDMPGASADQARLAHTVGLPSCLQANEPPELRQPAPGEYRAATHGNLAISGGNWVWNRGNFGSRSALGYLKKVRGTGFADAVKPVPGICAAPVFSLPAEKDPARRLHLDADAAERESS